MWSLSLRAFSYLAMSDMPFHDELADSQTHLSSPLIESFHLQSHVTVFLCSTSPHLCFLPSPMSGTGGTLASCPMLIVMSSGKMRAFRWPIFGCSPRPRKRPGGSTRKLPSFSLRPSTMAKQKGSSSLSFSAFAAFFCSLVIAFF